MSAKEKKKTVEYYTPSYTVLRYFETLCSFYRHNYIFRRSEHDETYLFVSFLFLAG